MLCLLYFFFFNMLYQLRKLWRYIPAKIQNSCCFEHCCFELLLVFTSSTIQHFPFTIQCAYFKCNVVRTCDILIQCSMCLYGVNAICFQRNPTSLFSAFLINIHICFQISSCNMQYSCLSMCSLVQALGQ